MLEFEVNRFLDQCIINDLQVHRSQLRHDDRLLSPIVVLRRTVLKIDDHE